MKKLKLLFVAMSMMLTLLLATNAFAYTPQYTFYAAGSSAMFNTFGLAAGYPIFPSPLCGTHVWSKKSGGGTHISLHDPRPGTTDEDGNMWIVWDDDAQNQVAGSGRICVYLTVDSIVGVRGYAARGTYVLPAALIGSAGGNVVPFLPDTAPLHANIQAVVNGATINVGMTDIRPEDAKFATMRVLTGKLVQTPGSGYYGQGYGPFPIGTPIVSAVSTADAKPVDFAIASGDTDPITGGPVRPYGEIPVGAAPVLVVANKTQVTPGRLGDPNLTNINRFILSDVLEGKIFHIRDVESNGASPLAAPPPFPNPNWTTSLADWPLHVFLREGLSGTFNTMEFCIPMAAELDSNTVAPNLGQEHNVTTNPLNQNSPVATANGFGTRQRVIGTGEMLSTVNGTTDGFGYAFWSFGAFNAKTNLKYLTVDGVDPLFSGPSANPGGPGAIPQCPATPCLLPFDNIVNGSYPVWSKLRAIYDFNDPTNLAGTVVFYAQKASNPVTGVFTDFVPAPLLQTFRSHFAQSITDGGIGIVGDNGFITGVPETGGDMGGAVLTINSEIDFIQDTGGNQQVNRKQ